MSYFSEEEEVVGTEVVPVVEATRAIEAGNIFGSENPVGVVAVASEVASALADVVERQNLYTTIRRKKHVRVEGWTLLGSMLGVFPVCEWSRPLPDGSGYEARVTARTLGGAVVGAAEAMCTRLEERWADRDDYALRSMAQTRATSKALRQPLGFVMTLAGFDATPVEEMDDAAREPVEQQGPGQVAVPKNWAEIELLVSGAFGEEIWKVFALVGAAARSHLYGDERPSAAQNQSLGRLAAGAAVRLREAFEPDELPGPTVEDVSAAWAPAVGGEMLLPYAAAEEPAEEPEPEAEAEPAAGEVKEDPPPKAKRRSRAKPKAEEPEADDTVPE